MRWGSMGKKPQDTVCNQKMMRILGNFHSRKTVEKDKKLCYNDYD